MRRLHFSVTAAEDPGYTVISQEELGGKTNAYIAYGDLAEVTVQIDGADVPLGEAIREESLTVPEIRAFARIDAQNGFCQEAYISEHGLAHFSYTYPECILQFTYDVYETPDGKQTLIDELYIFADGQHSFSHFYVDKESEWGYLLDREDWGLTFAVSNVSPTQMTFDYIQHGGQQIGTLCIDGYHLYSVEDNPGSDKASSYIGSSQQDSEGLLISILPDTSGQITINWSAVVGALEPGRYYLQLTISDNYEASEVHPLMANYYDKQSYHIPFTLE